MAKFRIIEDLKYYGSPTFGKQGVEKRYVIQKQTLFGWKDLHSVYSFDEKASLEVLRLYRLHGTFDKVVYEDPYEPYWESEV